MSRKFYTIFILPHAQETFRKIHVSRNFVLAVLGVAGLVALAGAVSPHLLFKSLAQASHLATLEDENRRLKQEKQQFEASLAQMGAQLTAFEQVAGRLARAVGLRDAGVPAPAGGLAPGGIPAAKGAQALLDEEMGALRSRTESLDRSFAALDEAWQAKMKILASTPSLWPVQGSFSDGYGWRPDPFTGEREFHKGVDIVAPLGTQVRAAADGLVTGSGRLAGYGKMVNLAHGYGLSTRYGHLSEILVRPGQRVHRGDVIGRVGSTGRSSGPHLHYEVLRGGSQVDPRRFLGDALF